MTTIADLMVKVGADLDELDSGVDKGVKSVEKSMAKIETYGEKAGASIEKAGAKAAKAFDGVRGSADQVGRAMDAAAQLSDHALKQIGGADAFAGLVAEARAAGKAVEVAFKDSAGRLRMASGQFIPKGSFDGVVVEGSAAARELQTAFHKVATGAQGTGRETGKKTGDGFVSGVLTGIGDLDNKLGAAVESTFDQLKGPALAGGAAAGATFMMGLNEHFGREAGADAVAARLGLDGASSARIGRISGDLYANAYGTSIEEVGTAVDAVMSTLPGMLTASDSAIEGTTAKAHDLATGFGLDVVQGVGLAGVAIQHGLAKDSDHAFDLIVASMQKMPAGMREELFPAIEEYGGFLNNMGFTGEEAFGLLAAASHDGMFAIDKTGDAIKELSIRSTDMSTLSVDSFKAAGLNAEEMAAKFLAGGDVARGALDELIDGLLGIEDPTTRANAAIGLFGTPLEDLSVTEIPTFLQSLTDMDSKLGDVSGTADEFGSTLNTNAAANIESFKRKALGGLVDFIGGKVIPAAQHLADTYGDDLERAFSKAAGFFKRNEKAMQGLAIVAGVTAALVVAHFVAMGLAATASAIVHGAKIVFMVGRWVFLAAQAILSAGRVAVAWLISNAGAIAAGIVAGVTFAIMVAGWIASGLSAMAGAAVIAAAWLIAIWPVALVIAAIALVAAMVVIHFDTIKRWISNVFNWVKENWPLLLAILTGPFGLAVLAIVKNWDTIKDAVTAAKNWIVDRFNDLVGFITGLPGRISDAASGMWEGIKGGLSAVVGWVWDQIRSLIRAYNSIPMAPNVSVPGSAKAMGSIPKSHSGELLPGGAGAEMLRIVQGGEEILDRNNPRNIRNLRDVADIPMPRGLRDLSGGGGGTTVIINNSGSVLAERDLVRLVEDAIERGDIRGAA